jgi:hypothetical protein
MVVWGPFRPLAGLAASPLAAKSIGNCGYRQVQPAIRVSPTLRALLRKVSLTLRDSLFASRDNQRPQGLRFDGSPRRISDTHPFVGAALQKP